MGTQLHKYQIDLGEVTQHNLKQLKLINQLVFPVSYSDKFYKDVLGLGELAKLAYLNDVVVGAVCCRMEPPADGKRKIHIMTLGCLAPYRRMGVGRELVRHVLQCSEKDPPCDAIYLHVQISNEEAMQFYRKLGFRPIRIVENYYRNITPSDAYLMERDLKEYPADQLIVNDPPAADQLLNGTGDVDKNGVDDDAGAFPQDQSGTAQVDVSA